MKKIFKKLISYTLYTLLCGVVFYYIALPKIIEKRATDLGLMQFKESENKLVEKDSLFLSGYDLHYLKKGSMDNYIGY